MYDKLEKIEARFNYLTESLADPDVISDNNKLRDVSKERSKLEPIIEKFYELKTIDNNLSEAQEYV
ncbi:MAG: PCRF domain-containing protein, partial [Candidatus Delongbacteria bacterium]|nr:PCRF domain-containing protein [Candidatus Delongbacteria bacterium]